MLERTLQREFENGRRLDEVERVQPRSFREMQPLLPRIEMAEESLSRNFYRFPRREFGESGGKIRWNTPLTHSCDRVLGNLPKRATDAGPNPGGRIGHKMNVIQTMFCLNKLQLFTRANLNR